MATRSRIGYIDPKDKSIKSVYCHYDGYPAYNGVILLAHYKTLDSVKALLENGNMSVLGASLDKCEFYSRDRGEKIEKNMPVVDVTLQGFKNRFLDSDQEFAYLLDENGDWICFSVKLKEESLSKILGGDA